MKWLKFLMIGIHVCFLLYALIPFPNKGSVFTFATVDFAFYGISAMIAEGACNFHYDLFSSKHPSNYLLTLEREYRKVRRKDKAKAATYPACLRQFVWSQDFLLVFFPTFVLANFFHT